MDDPEFLCKTVSFLGKRTSIILQNENGPCPLLAIANILFLKNKLKLKASIRVMKTSQILNLITNYMLAGSEDLQLSSEVADERGAKIEASMSVLPELQRGLLMNVMFKDCESFEKTTHFIVFDLLKIRVLHGWLPEHHNKEAHEKISELSYNEAMDLIVAHDSFSDWNKSFKELKLKRSNTKGKSEYTSFQAHLGDENEKIMKAINASEKEYKGVNPFDDNEDHDNNNKKEGQVKKNDVDNNNNDLDNNNNDLDNNNNDLDNNNNDLDNNNNVEEDKWEGDGSISGMLMEFFHYSISQLTYEGFFQLHQTMKDGELACFFRSNHFSVLHKCRGALYTLVTDEGYQRYGKIVWEKLTELEGDTIYVDSDFCPSIQNNSGRFGQDYDFDGNMEADHQLALKLSGGADNIPREGMSDYEIALAMSNQGNGNNIPVDNFEYDDESLVLAQKLQKQEYDRKPCGELVHHSWHEDGEVLVDELGKKFLNKKNKKPKSPRDGEEDKCVVM